MDSLVMTITLIGAAIMTLATAVAVVKGQFEQPIPIRVEEESHR
jgi:hypothetical protein